MQDIIQLHKEAMEFAGEAMLLDLQGDFERASYINRQAFLKEQQAAELMSNSYEIEPTRSVLCRSAATLAFKCGEIRESERLISLALSGNPPEEIAEELRDLLEQVYFQRHLNLRGVLLDPQEFQMSMTGDAVGFGIAQSDEFTERVRDVKNLVDRVAERKQGKPFNESGRRINKIELYLSVPRAASFAVTFRLGNSDDQLKIPGINFPELSQVVIDDLFEGLKILIHSGTEALKELIPDEAYLRNFVAIAIKIAPDGKKIKTVGLTATRNNREERLLIDIPKNQFILPPSVDESEKNIGEYVEVVGTLQFADSTQPTKGSIRVKSEEGVKRINVPLGMMTDIVKPMYGEKVFITGTVQKGGEILLSNIEPI